MKKLTLKKYNPADIIEYNKKDLEYMLELVSKKVEAITNSSGIGDVTVTVSKDPDLSIPMWLCTDKDGCTKIIRCPEPPVRNVGLNIWNPGCGDYMEACIDSPFAAKFFGIFWKKAAEELRKMGLPKWEDPPVEIEVSKIKINYY